MATITIGIIGYSAKPFDIEEANDILTEIYDNLEEKYPDDEIWILSGLTNVGIPKLAYEMAKAYELPTVGLSCRKALDCDCYEVDQTIIYGENWGDDSPQLMREVDELYRIGGGDIAMKEAQMAKDLGIPVTEYDLDTF